LDIFSARTFLFSGFITIHSKINSESTVVSVSSTTYSVISSSYDMRTFVDGTFESSSIF
jgi:hypothetical protein